MIFPASIALFFFCKTRAIPVNTRYLYFSLLYLSTTILSILAQIQQIKTVDPPTTLILLAFTLMFFLNSEQKKKNKKSETSS